MKKLLITDTYDNVVLYLATVKDDFNVKAIQKHINEMQIDEDMPYEDMMKYLIEKGLIIDIIPYNKIEKLEL